MRRLRIVGPLVMVVVSIFAAVAAEAPAQDPQPELPQRQRFNQVFVKLIVPDTSINPENDPLVESWIAGKLNKLGEKEYFAITDWVPVCDALLEDDVVDNCVWDGGRLNQIHYCPVSGDISDRKNGQLMVNVSGWLPVAGCQASITLSDEPGSRAIGPLQIEGQKPVKIEDPLPYVAVIIAPPERKELEAGMIGELDAEYQQQALQIGEKKLEEMDLPFRERTPTFKTVMKNANRLLEIRYSPSDPNVRAGDWILSFDPSKPIEANPVDIKIWR